MKYLLDTNICVYLIRNKSPQVLAKLTQQPVAEVGISSITAAELEFGVWKSSNPTHNRQALDQFLLPLTILEFDYGAAVAYGEIRAQLERQGTPIGSLDTLIAAHALSQGLTLVSNNTREFNRVPNLDVEDWTGS